MAIKAALGEDGFELWDAWSRSSDRYHANGCTRRLAFDPPRRGHRPRDALLRGRKARLPPEPSGADCASTARHWPPARNRRPRGEGETLPLINTATVQHFRPTRPASSCPSISCAPSTLPRSGTSTARRCAFRTSTARGTRWPSGSGGSWTRTAIAIGDSPGARATSRDSTDCGESEHPSTWRSSRGSPTAIRSGSTAFRHWAWQGLATGMKRAMRGSWPVSGASMSSSNPSRWASGTALDPALGHSRSHLPG